ncbi:MAG: T9SS type A sorting domain-containing protein [Bacteroidetes bacterium]|nr:T9SS type A sorting domain-containing protein [Bacteroidota bacterium]
MKTTLYFLLIVLLSVYTCNAKAISNPATQETSQTTATDLIKLHVSSTVTTYTDEMIVNFISTATPNQGVEKWFSWYPTAPSLYSVKNGINFTINTLPAVTDNLIIPVSFIAGVNGSYTITASELNSFVNPTYIYLKDLKTNFIRALHQNANYTFTGLTTDSPNRFQLIFTLSPCGWLGNTSIDWATSSNWENNLQPTILDNITLYSWAARQPHITSPTSNPAVCNDLKINSGSSLTIDAGKALTVYGTLTNAAGTSGLIIKSDASGTGSLIEHNGINATIERYIVNPDQYHMLSSPVTSQTINSIVSDADSFYVWSEPLGAWIEHLNAINFVAANNGVNIFIPGKAYAVSYPTIVTKNFIGNLNCGNINIPLTISQGIYSGWNFIANPYASSINWDAISGWTRNILEDAGNAKNAIWIWNAGLGNYGTYVSYAGIGTNGVTSNIATSQGFWVKVTNTGILSMDNSVREHADQVFFKSSPLSSDLLRLNVSCNENTYTDEVVIKFGNENNQGGAEKMFSIEQTAPSLYSTKMNKNWSINYLSTIFQNPFVSIGFKAGINGIYTIHASELSSFSSNTYFYLKDLTSNFIMDLNQNDTYTFFASNNDNANRFQIIFAASPLDIFDNKVKNTNIYSYKNFIYVNSNEVIQQINIYNIQGKLIKTINNITRNFVTDMNETDAGYYIVRVTTSKNIYSEKVSLK